MQVISCEKCSIGAKRQRRGTVEFHTANHGFSGFVHLVIDLMTVDSSGVIWLVVNHRS